MKTKQKHKHHKKNHGKPYLVPVPLSDNNAEFMFTADAKLVTKLKNFIVENPKTARKFLRQLDPNLELQSLHMSILNEHTKYHLLQDLLTPLLEGKDVGLMSESGVPGVADPGADLIRLAHANKIEVHPFVGPSSILLALMASGLNGQNFVFGGYLPIQKDSRCEQIKKFEDISKKLGYTYIFIETPYRNLHLWRDFLEVLNKDTYVSIAVDITGPKQYIKTAKVYEWEKAKWPDFDKIPAVFLMNASRHTK